MSKQLPLLSRSQAALLGAYSFGMVMSGQCGQTVISDYLAALEHDDPINLSARLQEWCYDAADKRGRRRQQVCVAACFAPLLRWVLARWDANPPSLVLSCDVTYLRDCFIVLSISVVYRACALPVAWKILPWTRTGSWQPYWLELLARLAPAVPADWPVVVLTDRGLYAKWLFLGIVAQGWHPLMRIRAQGFFHRPTQPRWRSLAALGRRTGPCWAESAICFRNAPGRLACTLLASRAEGCAEPWLLITDVSPAQAQLGWYRMRAWIECGFKDWKRGGWRWEQTKMTRPERAERLWLVMAVATLWVLSVGGQSEVQRSAPAVRACTPRRLSCFRQGLNRIHVANDCAAPLPFGRFLPDYDLSTLNLKIMPSKNPPL